ncbi:methylated-DNA--[protein]-cysteine S-methyltransferase [Jeongeupia chitinilytica]|uniref:Methylated-DNA--protein-cysteine methyltransferase n=1 Tax=Jeongeupia chitinilytica TaxID=1041641 RepID=A0ABQ3GVY3_9NEIS|nr:methylated-DNA--[protein]-cysteine S-methyltransferase [Jeongeupia chitinilytica]GHD56234.1 methylated-DNA--protein-cysteine methyltransferase [Jeongeupia chitinilytica]
MPNQYANFDSPLGKLKLVADDAALVAILWENDRPGRVSPGAMSESAGNAILMETARQLGEYFAGQRTRFALPLRFAGTAFQQQVWAALLTIPFGETRSYLDIATQIGNVRAVRAVGAANGRNPLSIVAPCHRVIATSGQLTGFAGGLRAKRFLLDLESAGRLFP